MSDSESRLSVVIGGGNGIGAACCHVMAQRGWRVAVADLDGAAAKAVAGEIGGSGYAIDIGNLEALEQLASDIERDQGPVHSLVVCAAAFQERFTPEEFPMDVYRRILRVNIEGTFNANRVFGGRMVKARRGSIVNIGSTVAHGSSPQFAYGPSKAATVNLTKCLASQWGSAGVRVNSVSPGATAVARVLARRAGRYANDLESHMALGRRVEPSEVAESVEFLASDRASAITGVDLLVDAGWLAASTWELYGGVPVVEE
jgi:NAD(P)-dependent dehydrogenase (short-subunit alcohol dehydrogenase family)